MKTGHIRALAILELRRKMELEEARRYATEQEITAVQTWPNVVFRDYTALRKHGWSHQEAEQAYERWQSMHSLALLAEVHGNSYELVANALSFVYVGIDDLVEWTSENMECPFAIETIIDAFRQAEKDAVDFFEVDPQDYLWEYREQHLPQHSESDDIYASDYYFLYVKLGMAHNKIVAKRQLLKCKDALATYVDQRRRLGLNDKLATKEARKVAKQLS